MRDPAGGYRADRLRREHEEATRRERRFFRFAVAAAIGWALLCAAALAVVGYVAYHFIAKAW